MAHTVSVVNRDAAGSRHRAFLDITGPASYTTGGEPLTPGQLGLGGVDFFPSQVVMDSTHTTLKVVIYDIATSKLLWFVESTGAEVAGAVDLSDFTFRVLVHGKG